MEIEWKTIRFGHLEEFKQMKDRIANKGLSEREAGLYILSFVLSWDVADADSGEPLPLAAPETLNLLSIPQYTEICEKFQEQMGSQTVPKVNASKPSSGQTRSKKNGRSSRSRPAGPA